MLAGWLAAVALDAIKTLRGERQGARDTMIKRKQHMTPIQHILVALIGPVRTFELDGWWWSSAQHTEPEVPERHDRSATVGSEEEDCHHTGALPRFIIRGLCNV